VLGASPYTPKCFFSIPNSQTLLPLYPYLTWLLGVINKSYYNECLNFKTAPPKFFNFNNAPSNLFFLLILLDLQFFLFVLLCYVLWITRLFSETLLLNVVLSYSTFGPKLWSLNLSSSGLYSNIFVLFSNIVVPSHLSVWHNNVSVSFIFHCYFEWLINMVVVGW